MAADLANNSEQFASLRQRCAELWRQVAEALGPGADHTEFIGFGTGRPAGNNTHPPVPTPSNEALQPLTTTA